jgi:hypothetical protein
MLSFSLALISMDALLFKYGAISLQETIQSSAVAAVMFNLINLAWRLIFGWHNTGGI